jgi:2-keto-3-deoxy-L-rhamnonate aldolase RhmA
MVAARIEVTNRAKQRLEAGSLALGVGLRQARTVDIARSMKTAGADWLFIDMEHSSIGVDTAAQICVASLDVGVAPLVRIPTADYGLAGRMLDGGALGIVMPHVESPAEAQELVRQLRYPPLGHRGITGRLVHFGYAVDDLRHAIEELDRATLLVATLESASAIKHASAIAAVDGIDCLLIGTNDLALDMGIPGQLDAPSIAAAYESVQTACTAHRKWLGMAGVTQLALVERYVRIGARLVIAGGDVELLIAAARERTREIRQISLA